MGQDTSRLDEVRVREALDLCLQRILRGESRAACLADHPDQAEVLAPLLRLAERLRATTSPVSPAVPEGLTKGRARMLLAAETLRIAEGAPLTNGHADLNDALLDTAIQLKTDTRPIPKPPKGLAAGRARMLAIAAAAAEAAAEGAETLGPRAESLDAAILGARTAGKAGADDSEQSEFLSLAASLRQHAAMPPTPPGELAAGRERFLDVAARSAAHHRAVASANQAAGAPARAGGLAAWRDLFQAGLGGVSRLAVASLAAVLLFLGATNALETQARTALPGDPLYGIKRINESIDLALAAFNSDSVSDLRAEQAHLRALEVQQLMRLGREAEGAIEGELLSFGRNSGADDEPYGNLTVRVPPRSNRAETFTYGWNDSTSFDPGAWGSMSSVPKGSRLKLRVVSARTPQGYALALAVRVLDQPDQPMTATATLTPTATVVLTPTASDPPTTATTRPIRPTDPVTPTLEPTVPVSPTVTLTPTRPPSATPETNEPELAPWSLNRFRGLVVAKQHPDLWTLREIASKDSVDFDLSLLPGEVKAAIDIGDLVELAYRKGTTPRLVERMILREADVACAEGRELGTIESIDANQLTLSNGSVYSIASDIAARPGLAPGAVVEILYRDCLGKRELLGIEISSPPAETVLREGWVEDLRQIDASTWRFRLDTGETVELGPSTEIRGMARRIANGQYVEVEGKLGANDRIKAERIDILELAAEATATASPTAEMGEAPPQPTAPGPAPGATAAPPGS